MEESAASQPALDESAQRLTRALAVMRLWPDSDDTPHAFLARYPDIRDELAPLLFGTGPNVSTLVGEDLMDERFRIIRMIGRGGMGSVYEAFDHKLQRVVAIKLLRTVLQIDDQARDRFRREAALMARMQHESIVAVHEIGEIEGSPFLVMALIDGVPLSRLIACLPKSRAGAAIAEVASVLDELLGPGAERDEPAARRRPDLAADYEHQVVAWVIDIAKALDYAHRHGLVHRDVKPSNILIARSGRALLTDFGLAREQGQVGLTVTGDFAGTPDYASPEHFGAPKALDARSDVFSLGATLYELLTQQRPFQASSEFETRERVVRYEPRAASALNGRVSRDLAAVVARALEKAPARRYRDAAAFAADLARWQTGFPVLARPVSAAVRMQRWVVRNKLASAFIAVLLVSMLLVSFFAWQTDQLLIRRDIDALGAEVDRVWEQASRGVEGSRNDRVQYLGSLLTQAQSLGQRRDELTARLADLRRGGARGEPSSDVRVHSRLRSELIEQRERLAEIEGLATHYSHLRPEVAEARERIESLEAARLETRGWRVDDRQEEHDRLADVVWSLGELATRQVPRIEAYLAWASSRDVEERAWQATMAAIAANESFQGLEIEPQTGLVPLGQDPESRLCEFFVRGTGTQPGRDAEDRLIVENDTGIVLVLLPPWPARKQEPFFCAKFEVSTAQLQCIVAGLPLRDDGMPAWFVRYPTNPRLPAVDVSWDEGKAILGMLDLEMPTGARWRWACVGPHANNPAVKWWTQVYQERPPGEEPRAYDNPLDLQAGFAALEDVANLVYGAHRPHLWHIDQRPTRLPPPDAFERIRANQWGLIQMHGNVKEWLADYALVGAAGSDKPAVAVRGRGLAGGSIDDSPVDSNDPDADVTGCQRFDQSDHRFRSPQIGLRPVRRLDR